MTLESGDTTIPETVEMYRHIFREANRMGLDVSLWNSKAHWDLLEWGAFRMEWPRIAYANDIIVGASSDYEHGRLMSSLDFLGCMDGGAYVESLDSIGEQTLRHHFVRVKKKI
jgi:hypothetical protein